jgi:hypothetical protein
MDVKSCVSVLESISIRILYTQTGFVFQNKINDHLPFCHFTEDVVFSSYDKHRRVSIFLRNRLQDSMGLYQLGWLDLSQGGLTLAISLISLSAK